MSLIMKFTIKLPPITKKNSQQILTNKATGRYFIAPSVNFKKYERNAMWFIPAHDPIDYPVNIKCLFYMDTRRRTDLTNLLEAIDDIMVKKGIIADDNYNVIESHDGSRVFYDKNNPRTEVYITSDKHLQVIKENNVYKCPECGVNIAEWQKYCALCGTELIFERRK